MSSAPALRERLLETIRPLGSAIVAYSGGVDSALVLYAATRALGREQVLGVTAVSPAVPARELEDARRVAEEIGARHELIHTAELARPGYTANGPDRCFHCKTELYFVLETVRKREGFAHILNGTNQDDLGDYRPGLRAASEARVQSPLLEAGFDKATVRLVADRVGLSISDKPASPCLASRIPYYTAVSPERLYMIEKAEDLIRALGARDVRVRHYGDTARVELPREILAEFQSGGRMLEIERGLRAIGFQNVVFDPEGLRSGNLNRALSTDESRL